MRLYIGDIRTETELTNLGFDIKTSYGGGKIRAVYQGHQYIFRQLNFNDPSSEAQYEFIFGVFEEGEDSPLRINDDGKLYIPLEEKRKPKPRSIEQLLLVPIEELTELERGILIESLREQKQAS